MPIILLKFLTFQTTILTLFWETGQLYITYLHHNYCSK